MPINAWSKTDAGLFHHFHQCWIGSLCDGLNAGLLPSDHFALIERTSGRFDLDPTFLLRAEPDVYGEALDPDGIVAQARRIVDEYGFTAIKLKGGVFPPEEEMAAIEALHAAFPSHPLRLDPNAAWTPQTSIKVASGLAGILEYLEDPTPGLDGMAEVAQQAPMPLATNMCVVAFDQLAPAVANLRTDPALRFSERGRSLLRWLDTHVAGMSAWGQIADSVPVHCAPTMATILRGYAMAWSQLAQQIEQRAETECEHAGTS